jgi:hypothetical protein
MFFLFISSTCSLKTNAQLDQVQLTSQVQMFGLLKQFQILNEATPPLDN